jgi:hypothetical protein
LPNTGLELSVQITGIQLLSAIEAYPRPIKWLPLSGLTRRVSPNVASAIVRAGVYVGKVTPAGRVIYIREVDKRTATPPDPSYWLDRACGLYRWPTPMESKYLDCWILDSTVEEVA